MLIEYYLTSQDGRNYKIILEVTSMDIEFFAMSVFAGIMEVMVLFQWLYGQTV